ncbi:MAG: hypothetical protein H0X30_35530 [Anaerolineae bacterium]|nr:hypothetical protein [Anaerolineae bacterium]
MFSKLPVRVIVLLAFFTLLVGSSVLADDGRINRAPYHFGGDTLFCNQEKGCTLLNKEGHDLANWPQDDIATAFAASDQSGQNTKVKGEGKGTYGPMQLWAVSPDETTGNNKLCLIGFDEWGKQNDMCFEVTKDTHYEQAPLPVTEADHSCDRWSVGDWVELIADHSKYGEINSIDLSNHMVNFGKSETVAKCSEIELGPR